ncbi:MAG: hypothetical protein M0P58_11580 [Bacteroidales bacterium]|nr:hypothetical protein [Bacteroidales bacterium]
MTDPGTFDFRASHLPSGFAISVNVPAGGTVYIESDPNGVLKEVSETIAIRRIIKCKKIASEKNE